MAPHVILAVAMQSRHRSRPLQAPHVSLAVALQSGHSTQLLSGALHADQVAARHRQLQALQAPHVSCSPSWEVQGQILALWKPYLVATGVLLKRMSWCSLAERGQSTAPVRA